MSKKMGPSILREIVTSRQFVILTVVLFAVFMAAAFASTVASATADRYLSLSTLDSNFTSDHYFAQPGNAMHVGDEQRWNLAVYNHMGQTEYISVRALLLDSSQQAPNDTSHLPAEGKTVFEQRTLVADNSTAIIPFDWSIGSQGQKNSAGLTIDGEKIPGFIAPAGKLRMVFELWRYDSAQDNFTFSWTSNSGQKNAWNEIWFSIAR